MTFRSAYRSRRGTSCLLRPQHVARRSLQSGMLGGARAERRRTLRRRRCNACRKCRPRARTSRFQLGIPGIVQQHAVLGRFGSVGDCALIRDALRAEVPVILTNDLRTFWRHRFSLCEQGVEIWRPSDVRQAYMNYSLMPSSPVYPPMD